MSRPSGRFSLHIRPLGELIDMYHAHEATERRDKVFALLGMSSDDPDAIGIFPNYKIPWRQLFQQLVKFLLGGEVSVKTWAETEMAVIEGKGVALGKVSSNHYGRQQVVITQKGASRHLGPEGRRTVQASAKSIQAGDIVYLLRGASRPIIIRPCKDYFSIVVIAAPLEVTGTKITGTENGQPRNLLLVWDWEAFQGDLRGRKYGTILRSQAAGHLGRESHFDKTNRLLNTVLILEDVEEYEEAEVRL